MNMRNTRILYSFVMTLLCLHTAGWGAEFFVALSGDDANPGTKEQPFQTLGKARDTVRGLIAAGLKEEMTVNLRGGTYVLGEPLVFDERDSGSARFPVTYQTYGDETVVISGGQVLSGRWLPHSGTVWKLPLPSVRSGNLWFRQLFLSSGDQIKRLTRARWPNTGHYLRFVDVDNETMEYAFDQDLPAEKLTVQDNAEVEVFTSWVSSRARIAGASGRTLTTETIPGHQLNVTRPKKKRLLFLEHAYAFIDRPGEWFLDRTEGVLYLKTKPGVNPNDQTFTTGRLETLLRVSGRVDRPVVNLNFRKLRFRYSQWRLPEIGFGDMWTGNYGGPKGRDWVRHIPVALQMEYVQGCRVEMCEIAHMGGSGIGFGRGAVENRVAGCHVHDISGIGINFGWRTLASPSGDGWVHYDRVLMTDVVKAWGGEAHVSGNNFITDNHVHHCGQVYSGCAGIFLAFQRNFNISRNYVHSLPYGCIVHQHYTGERENCVSSCNQVFNSMLLLGDGGGIYNSVTDTGAHIHHNYVYDIFKHPGSVAWGNVGIYLDDYGANCLAEYNALHNIASSEIKVRSKGHLIRLNRGVKEVLVKEKIGQADIIDPEKQAVELTDEERKTLAAETGPREPYRTWLGIH